MSLTLHPLHSKLTHMCLLSPSTVIVGTGQTRRRVTLWS